jgi:cAMP-dependent protein kinase regulator
MGLKLKKPRIDHLDRYIADQQYDRALDAVAAELKRNPRQFNLLLRQAEILGLSGSRDRATRMYREIAEKQAREGFYARAIALYKKVLRLNPELEEVHAELARLIDEDLQSKQPLEERLRRQQSATKHAPAEHGDGSEEDQQTKELRASALFGSFSPEALEEILSSTLLRSYEEGDIVVTEGEHGSSLFLLVTGDVKVFTRGARGEHLPLAELGPGDFFGEVSLLTGKPRTATITAKSKVTAIELAKDDVDRIATEYPEVPQILEEFYNRRAQDTVEAVIARLRQDKEATS